MGGTAAAAPPLAVRRVQGTHSEGSPGALLVTFAALQKSLAPERETPPVLIKRADICR